MLKKIIIFIKKVSLFKSLFFCFRFFPFKVAVRLPVLLGYGVNLRSTKGEIEIVGPVKTGMVTFGVLHIFRDDNHSRTNLYINGKLIFHGHAIFHTGIIMSVENGAVIQFGENFIIGADSLLYSRKHISFGNEVHISWNFHATDTDFHYLRNINNGEVLPNTKPIRVGNNVWIGNNVALGKGAQLPDGSIVSTRSFVNKVFDKENCIIGGIPAKCIKEGFERIIDFEEEATLNARFRE